MDVAAGLPEGAVRVRADEVRPGDRLVVDGEAAGYVAEAGLADGYNDLWYFLLDDEAGFLYRGCFELVWVVRPEPTVTLTITLPETVVRERAPHSPRTYVENWVRPLHAACVEWVAAHPQDERNEP